MPRNIILAASLPAAPDRLFDMYLDPGSHAAFTGRPVTVAALAAHRSRHLAGRYRGPSCMSSPSGLSYRPGAPHTFSPKA